MHNYVVTSFSNIHLVDSHMISCGHGCQPKHLQSHPYPPLCIPHFTYDTLFFTGEIERKVIADVLIQGGNTSLQYRNETDSTVWPGYYMYYILLYFYTFVSQ